MRKDYMLMTFMTSLVNSVWSNLVVEFSRSLRGAYILTTIQGVSIETCQHECEMRKRCTDAVYQRRPAYCVLTSASTGVQRISNVGAVLMSGFNPDNKTFGAVNGTKIRSPSEICKSNTSTTIVCQVRECGSPSPSTVSGNIYTVGSQLLYSCRFGAKRVTCGPEGVWIHHTAYAECSGPCGVTGLYITPQQQLYCDMSNNRGDWTRRYDGSVDFFRNWTDYKDGFGDLHGEFWLGLEQIHQTVSKGVYELRIDMEDFEGNERFAKYDTFKIHGEEDNYRLVVTGWSGNCGNSLSYQSGMMFSTQDRDNDFHKTNCAQRSHGAWWYNGCHTSNLNGRYLSGGHSDTYAANINWKTWRGFYYSLRKTEMKMRGKK